jgi:hypothetical protein
MIAPIEISHDGTVVDTTTPEEAAFYSQWQPVSTATEKDLVESRRVAQLINAVPKQCWWNARRAILKLDKYSEASLIEGWALVEGVLAIEHGWIVNNGAIIDPTLPDDPIQYFPGLEFRGRREIQEFLGTPRGRKCKRTAMFFAFGWAGMNSPSFRRSWEAVEALMVNQSGEKR